MRRSEPSSSGGHLTWLKGMFFFDSEVVSIRGPPPFNLDNPIKFWEKIENIAIHLTNFDFDVDDAKIAHIAHRAHRAHIATSPLLHQLPNKNKIGRTRTEERNSFLNIG